MPESNKRKNKQIYKDDNVRSLKKTTTKSPRVYNEKDNRFNSNNKDGVYTNIFEHHNQDLNFNENYLDMRIWREKTVDSIFSSKMEQIFPSYDIFPIEEQSDELFHKHFSGVNFNLESDTQLEEHIENISIDQEQIPVIKAPLDSECSPSMKDMDLNLESLYWYLKLVKLRNFLLDSHWLFSTIKQIKPKIKKSKSIYTIKTIKVVSSMSTCDVDLYKKSDQTADVEDIFLLNRILKENKDCGKYDIVYPRTNSMIQTNVLNFLEKSFTNQTKSCSRGRSRKIEIENNFEYDCFDEKFVVILTKPIEWYMESIDQSYQRVNLCVSILERRFQKFKNIIDQKGNDAPLFKFVDYMMSYGDGDLIRYMYCNHQELMIRWCNHDYENTFYRIIEFLSGYNYKLLDTLQDRFQIKNILFTLVPKRSNTWGQSYMNIKSRSLMNGDDKKNESSDNIQNLFISFFTFRTNPLRPNKPQYYHEEIDTYFHPHDVEDDHYDMDFELMERLFGKEIYDYMAYILGQRVTDFADYFDNYKFGEMSRPSMFELKKKMIGEFNFDDFENGSFIIKQKINQFLSRLKFIGMFDIIYIIEMCFKATKIPEIKRSDLRKIIVDNGIFESAILWKLGDIEKESDIVSKSDQLLTFMEEHMYEFMKTHDDEETLKNSIPEDSFPKFCQKIEHVYKKTSHQLEKNKETLKCQKLDMKLGGVYFFFPKKQE